MPDITVVVWNIETFGDRWDAQRGATYLPMIRFIARVLDEVDADVFMMMELRSNGALYLDTLQVMLNALADRIIWQYDYIPGAVLDNRVFPITNANQLGFMQPANGEGYAVFWRNANTFTMRAMRLNLSGHPTAGNSYISLVFTGRTPVFNNQTGWFVASNFNPANSPVPWNELDFPEPNPIHAGDLRWTRARRPCYCVLDLNRGGGRAHQLLPLVIYHAPNSLNSTPFGVQASAYSTQLYQVDDTAQGSVTMITVNQAIAAGDYNLDRNQPANRKVDAYLTLTNPFNFGNNNNEGGANLPNTWVADPLPVPNLTAVRLSDQNGQPITGVNPDDYRWLAIDNLFYRGLNIVAPAGNYSGPVYNVIQEICGNGGNLVNTQAKRNVLQAFGRAIRTELRTGNYRFIDPNTHTPSRTQKRQRDGTFIGPVVANLLDYDAYMDDLNYGYFSDARRAAEFYFNSISDHLPLVFRFTV